MKRNRKLLICLTDAEFDALDRLVATYSLDGHRASKSFLVRYALKRLPYQQGLPLSVSAAAAESAC